MKGRGPESVRRGHRELKENDPTPEFMAHGQVFTCITYGWTMYQFLASDSIYNTIDLWCSRYILTNALV